MEHDVVFILKLSIQTFDKDSVFVASLIDLPVSFLVGLDRVSSIVGHHLQIHRKFFSMNQVFNLLGLVTGRWRLSHQLYLLDNLAGSRCYWFLAARCLLRKLKHHLIQIGIK